MFDIFIDKHLFGCYIYIEQEFGTRVCFREENIMFGKRRVLFTTVTFMFVMISALSIASVLKLHTTEAKELHAIQTYYTSIEVKANDSLYSYAKKYNSKEVQSDKAYINLLMDINHLTDSRIDKGMKLVVPYYRYSR